MEQTAKLGVKDCNCVALRRAARRISNFYDAELASSGLRATQFAILAVLHDMGEASVNSVAERLALDRTTAGKNLRPLEKAGLIKVAPSASDGRMRVITLSREGYNVLKKAVPLWRAAQKSFEKWNGAENSATLRATLHGLRLET
jgi:DNA-binding MarR family transcriptional regulator